MGSEHSTSHQEHTVAPGLSRNGCSHGFYDRLKTELAGSIANDLRDNFDHFRWGPERPRLRRRIKRLLKGQPLHKWPVVEGLLNRPALYEWMLRRPAFDPLTLRQVRPFVDRLEVLHSLLHDEASRELLVKLMAYHVLGYRKVKLPLNTESYWEGIRAIEQLVCADEIIETSGANQPARLIDLHAVGFPVKIYYNPKAVYTTFMVGQYDYGDLVRAEPGDVVFDLGGCYGDTALFFANRVGPEGRVFCGEFIPGNLRILRHNVDENPALRPRIEVVEQPFWSATGTDIYFIDSGPSSRVRFGPFTGCEGRTTTTTIDQVAGKYGLDRVDFIKMDIEGAEQAALEGGLATIRKHRPKLAISIYHNMEQFVGVAKFLAGLDLGYRFFLGHATIHNEETVLFGTADVPVQCDLEATEPTTTSLYGSNGSE
jgi:FkbM family methyltransferase